MRQLNEFATRVFLYLALLTVPLAAGVLLAEVAVTLVGGGP
jgi:hypothetical protein